MLQRAQKSFYNGYFEQALRDFSRALSLDKALPLAWVGQVRSLLAMGEVKEALIWCDKGSQRYPHSGDVTAVKALALCKGGRKHEALSYSDGSLQAPSDSGFPWLVRGIVLLYLKRSKVADHCFRKFLEEYAGGWMELMDVGDGYLSAKRYQEAVTHLSKAASKHTESPYLWYSLGKAYRGLRIYSQAEFYMKKAIEIRPSYKDAIEELQGITSGPAGFLARLFGGS